MYVITFVFLSLLDITSSLDCYNCSSVRSPSDCHQITVCSNQENCFTEAFSSNGNIVYSLGCRAQQLCFVPSIVGRSEDKVLQCRECCDSDACNKKLCASVQSTVRVCTDDKTFDCQRSDNLFNICDDIQNAKTVCKEYCGLCNLVDGNWSVWSQWSNCGVTCGSGTRSRLRQCDNPAPSGNGSPCVGSNTDTRQCTLSPCPVNGGWSSWSPWGGCSTSCGVGLRTRDRTCTSPTPEPNGQYCNGPSIDHLVCILQTCADGGWSTWSHWSKCSASCQGGISSRQRYCNNPTPSQLGHDCIGNNRDQRICNNIACTTTTTAPFVPVRLVNGGSSLEGRLEVLYGRQWGTVCDDDFDAKAAQVVCRMLGAPSWSTARSHNNAFFGQGSLPIILDDVICRGSESSIFDCSHVLQSDCTHAEDVGVSCILATTTAPFVPVRLVNGGSSLEGRLEVFYSGQWGTVCDDNFDAKAAQVVCKMLGAPSWSTAKSYTNAFFGQGSLPIILDDVICRGTETSIFDCSHVGFNGLDCEHSEDVGVSCIAGQPGSHSVRLFGGKTMYDGQVEIYYNKQWWTVCDDNFNLPAAQVVCRMLNFPWDAVGVYPRGHYVTDSSLTDGITNIQCVGTENSIFDCYHQQWGTDYNCRQGVGVDCQPKLNVRLFGGTQTRGLVEVSLDGTNWGTVCDDKFGDNDARVVCRMLGLPTINAETVPGAITHSGPIFLDEVVCNGNERSLLDCSRAKWQTHDCDHTEDVSVWCH
ncbi:Scavenger receptor Cys-rich [Mactra antiquata]